MSKELIQKLATFTSTADFYEYHPNIFLSDGVSFLHEKTNLNWLMEIIHSSFMDINLKAEGFAVIHARVNKDEKSTLNSADVFIHNGHLIGYWEERQAGTTLKGDGNKLLQSELIHKQHKEEIAFPLDEITLYFQYRDTVKEYPRWILMLASEY